MELGGLITWALGLVVVALSGAWARTAAAISRNGREVAELRGRLVALEGSTGELKNDVSNAHKRIGGIGRTADRTAGRMDQAQASLSVVLERLVVRSGGDGGGG